MDEPPEWPLDVASAEGLTVAVLRTNDETVVANVALVFGVTSSRKVDWMNTNANPGAGTLIEHVFPN